MYARFTCSPAFLGAGTVGTPYTDTHTHNRAEPPAALLAAGTMAQMRHLEALPLSCRPPNSFKMRMEPTAPTRGQTRHPREQTKPGRVRSFSCRCMDACTVQTHPLPELEQTACPLLCPLSIRTATRSTETRREGPHAPTRSTQIRRNFNTQRWPKCRQLCNWIFKLMHRHLRATRTQRSHPWVCVVQRCGHNVM